MTIFIAKSHSPQVKCVMPKHWFDFKDFSARVAEMNRLHQAVHESSELRWRTRRPADIAAWEKAVDVWKDYSGVFFDKFYIFENDRFLAALASGEAEAKKCALTFLVYDPYYYRSGYMKAKLLVRLKHLPLTGDEAARMRGIVCKAILDRRPKCEFRYYARMLKNVGTPEFRRQIRALTVSDIPYLKDRQAMCLQKVYWKDLSD